MVINRVLIYSNINKIRPKIKAAKVNIDIDSVTREMNDHQREQDLEYLKIINDINIKYDDEKNDKNNHNNQKPQSKFCHQCGTKLKEEYRFCIQCGQKLL